MYSEKIKQKVEKMFNDLRIVAQRIVVDTNSTEEAMNIICQRICSETASRSKTMLSDMLFELNDWVLQTNFFSNAADQNKFIELNLRQEILSKYQFTSSVILDYQEASCAMQAIKVGGSALAIGGICEIGTVLKAGLSLSNLVPIPVGVLIAIAFGAAMVDYLAVEPYRNQKNFSYAIDSYFSEAQQQFLNWFDEVENYFNKRVDELKQNI